MATVLQWKRCQQSFLGPRGSLCYILHSSPPIFSHTYFPQSFNLPAYTTTGHLSKSKKSYHSTWSLNNRFNTLFLTSIQLSVTLPPAVWLHGALGREGEVECGRVSAGEEEHPNGGPQWGGVCPVPGRGGLAPGLLQRRSGEGDRLLQHKHHGWDRVSTRSWRWSYRCAGWKSARQD